MLGKLMKYDLMSAMRSFGPLYLVLLAMSVVIGLFIRFNVTENFLMTFLIISYGVTMIVCWVVPIVILTLRFKKNLLGDEGYLSFALPVSTFEQIVAKVLSALIITVICAAVVILSFLITGFFAASFDQLRIALQQLAGIFHEVLDVNLIPQLLKGLAMLILSSVQFITQIYAALAIGHLFKDHETLGAAIAFIAMSFLLSTLVNTLGIESVAGSAGIYALFTVAVTAVFTAVTWFILDRNLNLG